MTNWNNVLNGGLLPSELEDFAQGNLSGRDLLKIAKDYGDDEARLEVRSLLRENGVDYARRLTRKALSRR